MELLSTDPATLATVYFIMVAAVALKAFQQRNVVFDRYLAIMPTSLGMAVTEVLIVVHIVAEGAALDLILSMGLGGGTGALIAMTIHKRLFKERDNAGIRRRDKRISRRA